MGAIDILLYTATLWYHISCFLCAVLRTTATATAVYVRLGKGTPHERGPAASLYTALGLHALLLAAWTFLYEARQHTAARGLMLVVPPHTHTTHALPLTSCSVASSFLIYSLLLLWFLSAAIHMWFCVSAAVDVVVVYSRLVYMLYIQYADLSNCCICPLFFVALRAAASQTVKSSSSSSTASTAPTLLLCAVRVVAFRYGSRIHIWLPLISAFILHPKI